jgi:hypothetical protein
VGIAGYKGYVRHKSTASGTADICADCVVSRTSGKNYAMLISPRVFCIHLYRDFAAVREGLTDKVAVSSLRARSYAVVAVLVDRFARRARYCRLRRREQNATIRDGETDPRDAQDIYHA